MLQGANETGDYFWDVWREAKRTCGAGSNTDRAVFLSATIKPLL